MTLGNMVERELADARERVKIYELIDRLKEEDRSFSHNCFDIKDDICRGEFNANYIIRKLRQTYRMEEFTVNNSVFVRRIIREGDTVKFRHGNIMFQVYLNDGARGVVKKCILSDLVVRFNDGVTGRIPCKNLIVYGTKGGLLRKEKRFPETLAIDLDVRKDDLVKYFADGKESPETVSHLPSLKGSRATVVDHNHYCLRVKFQNYPSILKTWVTHYEDVNLIVSNNVDFDKIYREVFWR